MGAVRTTDIIPHDDDADVFVEDTHADAFKRIRWDKHGIRCETFDDEVWVGLKLYKGSAFVDVFYRKSVDGQKLLPGEGWPEAIFRDSELEPAKLYRLGSVRGKPLMLRGPHDPVPYLDRTYGKTWRTPVWDSPHDKLSTRFIVLTRVATVVILSVLLAAFIQCCR